MLLFCWGLVLLEQVAQKFRPLSGTRCISQQSSVIVILPESGLTAHSTDKMCTTAA